jgi:hypothetical protein
MTTEQPEAVSLATIDWRRGKWSSAKGKYSREHTWLLAGGVKLRVSDSESMVPEAYRDAVQLDPEKMFVATIASAHMALVVAPGVRDGRRGGELSGRSGGRPE